MLKPREVETTDVAGCREALRRPVQRCAEGELPPNVALAQLVIAAEEPAQVGLILADAARRCDASHRVKAASRLREALKLWSAHPDAWRDIRGAAAAADHSRVDDTDFQSIRYWAEAFDRAARLSPEASIALYSLGNAKLLGAATDEIVSRIRAWGLLGAERNVLEIGCGIGRFLPALAAASRLAVGVDISRVMAAQARHRSSHVANASVVRTTGLDLAAFAGRSFDLVLAVDSFAYLVQSGVATAHVREAARVLKPDGALLIFNFSYRGDLEADRADVVALAREAGFEVERNGTRDLSLWDGTTFLLRRTRVVQERPSRPAR